MKSWRAVDTQNWGRLKMESRRVCRHKWWKNSHHFSEEQDPDPNSSENLDQDSPWSEKLDPDLHQSDADLQPCLKVTFVDCPNIRCPLLSFSKTFFIAYFREKRTLLCNSTHFTSVVDPHWFHCGSGASFLSQCGSRSGSKEPTNADPDPSQSQKVNFYIKNVLKVGKR